MAGQTEEKTSLEVKTGGFAQVKKSPSSASTELHIGVRHVYLDDKERAKTVFVQRIPRENSDHVGLIFSFQYQQQRYFPSVRKDSLVLRKKTEGSPPLSPFLWEKDGADGWCRLKSVAEPVKYLCVEEGEFTVSSDSSLSESSLFRLSK